MNSATHFLPRRDGSKASPALAGLLVLVFAGLAFVFDFAAHPGLYYLGVTLCFVCLLGWSRIGGERHLSLTWLLGVAVVLRALFLPLPPSLSDDVYRYLWDGQVLLAGNNPYALAPDADSLEGLRGLIWERTAHRDVETVYPPLALGLFSISALLPESLLLYKALLVVLDLLGCALLWRLAKERCVPTGRVVWYAWNPLVVIEGSGMGHIDLAGVAAVLATVLLLSRKPSSTIGRANGGLALAGLCAAAGALIKLVPIVALPFWTTLARPRTWFATASIGVIFLASLLVLLSVGGIPPGLVTYGLSWEFNGPVFEPLYRLLESAHIAPLLKGLLDRVKALIGGHELLNPLYRWIYPQLLAKVLLAIAALAVIVGSLGSREVVQGTGRVLVGVLLFSATLYPWYLVWVLPFASLLGNCALLLLAFTVQLSYLPELCGVQYFPGVYLAIWTPVVLTFAWQRWRRSQVRS